MDNTLYISDLRRGGGKSGPIRINKDIDKL